MRARVAAALTSGLAPSRIGAAVYKSIVVAADLAAPVRVGAIEELERRRVRDTQFREMLQSITSEGDRTVGEAARRALDATAWETDD